MTANEEVVAIQQSAQEVIEEQAPILEKLSDEEIELDKFLETVPTDQHSPQDVLAAFYERHLKAVKHDINQLGSNALRRIIVNVLMGEFAPKEYQPNMKSRTGKLEKSVAYHFNEGVERRMLLRFEMEFGKAQEAYEKEQADLAKIEEMNKLTPEAQAVLENMQGTTLGENNG